jgi:hypothetical protein
MHLESRPTTSNTPNSLRHLFPHGNSSNRHVLSMQLHCRGVPNPSSCPSASRTRPILRKPNFRVRQHTEASHNAAMPGEKQCGSLIKSHWKTSQWRGGADTVVHELNTKI